MIRQKVLAKMREKLQDNTPHHSQATLSYYPMISTYLCGIGGYEGLSEFPISLELVELALLSKVLVFIPWLGLLR